MSECYALAVMTTKPGKPRHAITYVLGIGRRDRADTTSQLSLALLYQTLRTAHMWAGHYAGLLGCEVRPIEVGEIGEPL